MKIISITLILLTILLISCESQEHIVVTVIDKDTSQPLDSVKVQIKAGNNDNYDKNHDEGFTDRDGKYETYMMIGCSFGCYDIQTSYSKSGYEKLVQVNNIRDTIELEKTEL